MNEGWKLVKLEPEAAPVKGDGANGNGHMKPLGRRSPCQRERSRNRSDERAPGRGGPEAQQALFSWAEFMARRPQGNVQPASMFEWELTPEQERLKETVGASRSATRHRVRVVLRSGRR